MKVVAHVLQHYSTSTYLGSFEEEAIHDLTWTSTVACPIHVTRIGSPFPCCAIASSSTFGIQKREKKERGGGEKNIKCEAGSEAARSCYTKVS